MTDIGGLIERVEAATGPDGVLDGEIWRFLTEKPGDVWVNNFGDGVWHLRDPVDTVAYERPPRITDSIDAALALVERKLPGAWWVIAKGRMQASEPLFGCELLFGADQQLGLADGPTPALAVVGALLRALSARSP